MADNKGTKMADASLPIGNTPPGDVSQIDNILNGKRILLVEDNEDLQLLFSLQIRKSGALLDIAMDGVQGLDLAKRSSYDIVLMDMQLPKLDGYEATQRLRQAGYDGLIVALTAHTMKGERDRCIDAGCDEYISKPVGPSLLIKTISQIYVRLRPEPAKAAAKENQSQTTRPCDLSAVPDKVSVPMERIPYSLTSLYQDDENVRSVIPFFVEGLSQNLGRLEASYETLDWAQAAKIAHKLKGSSSCYGYPDLAEVARKIELEAKGTQNASMFNIYLKDMAFLAECVKRGLSS